jgi:hypothetical protein
VNVTDTKWMLLTLLALGIIFLGPALIGGL